jgi:hypothetical protein
MSGVVVRILFSLLSFFYIAAIFILAGSPVVDMLSEFNPYSLLHIPLYGILTFLLIFSMVPMTRGFKQASIPPGSDSRPRSRDTVGLTGRLFVAGAIGLVVGILDEVYQLSVPGREASVSDVVFDMTGIAIALLLWSWLFKTRFLSTDNSKQ